MTPSHCIIRAPQGRSLVNVMYSNKYGMQPDWLVSGDGKLEDFQMITPVK